MRRDGAEPDAPAVAAGRVEGTVGAVRSGAAEAANGAPGSPPVGEAAAAELVVGAEPGGAEPREAREVLPDASLPH